MTSEAPTDHDFKTTDAPSAMITPDHAKVIRRLALIIGIEPSYVDVMGTTHDASLEAQGAVLKTLGYQIETLTQACNTLRALRQKTCARRVPEVTVLRRQRQSFVVPVMVSETETPANAPLHWTITLEDGSRVKGEGRLSPPGPWTPPMAPQIVEALMEPLPDEDPTMVPPALDYRILTLEDDLPDGYHWLEVSPGDTTSQGHGDTHRGLLIVAPAACWMPDDPNKAKRLWGLCAQLYSVRSDKNWGMGDLGDLATLCKATGEAGGDLVGINPIHALFLPKPEDASPYSPNSRLFLNPLYISVEDVPEFATCAEAKERLADPAVSLLIEEARNADHVQYTKVATVKLDILTLLHQTFCKKASRTRRAAYEAFCEERGERLENFARFQALQEDFPTLPWPQWPEDFHSPASRQVEAFAKSHAQRVDFHRWLQFECDRQLAHAAQTLSDAGGSLGLYRDLAVGASPDGADVWTDPQAYIRGIRVGAPPDALGPLGQDWGLPPLNPQGLARTGYGPFIDMVRANMRHAGALRIDHAMALQHLFWIPPGMTAAQGVYLTYPEQAMVAVLAIESHRARCVIIGEDLGTVPAGFRDRMAAENILSYRLLYFERYEDSGLFMRPDTYPHLALSTPTSHDLATIAGNWRGWDVAMRHRLGLCGPDADEPADQAVRAHERDLLRAALVDQGFLPGDFPLGADIGADDMATLITACHRFLARAPSLLMLANLDDLAAEVSQVNVPGTVLEYPNWRRRLSLSLEELLHSPQAQAGMRAIAEERTRSSGQM